MQGETWSVVDVPPNPTSWLIEGAVAGEVLQAKTSQLRAFLRWRMQHDSHRIG